ncbi:MAG: molybdate ABC transporter substrate-binding protein, partial [Flammeovirgaceae bacterium]
MKKVILCCIVCVSLLACSDASSTKLTIATAANMQYAMRELTQTFTAQTGIECELVISSSGKLSAQILADAPYDVFVSADLKYPTNLFEAGKTLTPPKVYAYGKLVLWSLHDEFEPNMDALQFSSIRKIAIANPRLAPYGKAALEALQHLQLYEQVQDKLVFGESIAQTNQFIASQAVDCGITAKSVVLSPKLKSVGKWIAVDPASYTPI